MVFEVLDRVWNSKNQKKSITIGLDRLREAENETKTGQESLRKRKMKQREGFQRKKEAYKVTRCTQVQPGAPTGKISEAGPGPVNLRYRLSIAFLKF